MYYYAKISHQIHQIFQEYTDLIEPISIDEAFLDVTQNKKGGLEPDTRCFCNIHELSYQTKATRKEQYHNNFGCYNFVPRSEASYPVPTFRKNGQALGCRNGFM